MATFTHYLQGSTDTTITSTDRLQFAGGTFDSAITVGEYNDSTHVKDDTDSDKSSGNSPNNNKYGTISSWPISTGDCALKINFSHSSSVETQNAIFYAYDGSDTTAGPSNVTFYAAEGGVSSSWTNAEGSGSALALADNTSAATSHDFYLAVSASPDTVGTKTGNMYRIELEYL